MLEPRVLLPGLSDGRRTVSQDRDPGIVLIVTNLIQAAVKNIIVIEPLLNTPAVSRSAPLGCFYICCRVERSPQLFLISEVNQHKMENI